MTTALMWTSGFAWHQPGPGAHVFPAGPLMQPGEPADSPDRVTRAYALADAVGLTDHLRVVRPRAATEDELLRVHTPAYLARFQELCRIGAGDAGEGAPVTATSYDAATLAAGGCIRAVELVLDGEAENAYALVRPAGHHAEADRGRGSCMLANEALAALHARETRGVRRIAIVDWDVHHGNGMQSAFWNDPDVLTISVHQDQMYPPESGGIDEVGGPDAQGSNVNVPLPPGSGDGAYFETFDRIVLPALRRFQPELIIVAAGYDAGMMEQNGSMLLHTGSFRRLAQTMLGAAEELCGGRLVVTHNGGFNLAQVPLSVLAVLETLAGAPATEDPYFTPLGADNPWQALQPHQSEAIERAAGAHDL